jgi:predicted nucleotidyltransferase
VSTHPTAVRDLDHVVMTDGRIYRVVGNLDHPAKFVGYNVYSPNPAGDRIFRSTHYRKNFTEDDELPNDALDTYGMLPKARICEHLDPRTAATTQASTFADSPWAGLHAELNALFGANAVGIFGSAMLGMHLTPDGTVRKDVDFVIEGTGNIPVLREQLPAIRSKLGFTEVTSARQGRQYERYRRVFRNQNNSTDLVITRRWTALQAPNGVVTTIRFRDATVRTPYQLAGTFPIQAEEVTLTGQVADADLGNLFPRMFRLVTAGHTYTVHLWWWRVEPQQALLDEAECENVRDRLRDGHCREHGVPLQPTVACLVRVAGDEVEDDLAVQGHHQCRAVDAADFDVLS